MGLAGQGLALAESGTPIAMLTRGVTSNAC
jgi:hypothetical protein